MTRAASKEEFFAVQIDGEPFAAIEQCSEIAA